VLALVTVGHLAAAGPACAGPCHGGYAAAAGAGAALRSCAGHSRRPATAGDPARRPLLLGAALLGSAGLATPPALGLNSDEKLATLLFERVTPGVVSISKEPPQAASGEERTPNIAGSGFVWDEKHVVTNAHVIGGSEKPFVTFLMRDPKTGRDRRTTLDAVVVGSDAASDVAVLRVGGSPKDSPQAVPAGIMQPLPRGTSTGLLVGQNVFAFGNPFGLEHSLSRGIISGLSRKMEGQGGRPISGVVQTDASINPGNSGGPLLNSEGQVIGVNTAILSGSGSFAGVGLAIPIDTVSKNVESIIAKGFVRRPVLGIVFAPDIMSEELQLNGIMVMRVVPGGPAETAGVRPMRGGRLGDVVVSMDGKRISSTDDVFGILDTKAPGQSVALNLQRASSNATSDGYEDVQLMVELGQAAQ